MRILILAALLALLAVPASARPTVIELFTSQSCSSCPPAEALLTTLHAQRTDILPLEFHVDYWNALNWRDPYSSRAATARQRAYAAQLGTEVFTPQIVIDGKASAIGSDRAAIEAAIVAAERDAPDGPPITLQRVGGSLTIGAGAGTGRAALLLIGYDSYHRTQIAAGENGGVVLEETNIVRSLQNVANWRGTAIALTAPPPAGEHAALILQRPDGTILAAAAVD